MFFYACNHQQSNSPCPMCHGSIVIRPCEGHPDGDQAVCQACGGFGQTRGLELPPTMPDDWVKSHNVCTDCEGTGKVDGLASKADTDRCKKCGGSGSKPGGLTDSVSFA